MMTITTPFVASMTIARGVSVHLGIDNPAEALTRVGRAADIADLQNAITKWFCLEGYVFVYHCMGIHSVVNPLC